MRRLLVLAEKASLLERMLSSKLEYVEWFTSLDEATNFLSKNSEPFSHLYFDPVLAPPLGMPIIRQVMKRSPLCSLQAVRPHPALTSTLANRLKIRRFAGAVSFRETDEEIIKTVSATDESFMAIAIALIPIGLPLNFDLFHRLGVGHFVRILLNGQGFQESVLTRYKNHELKNLFVFYEHVEEYTNMLDVYSRLLAGKSDDEIGLYTDLLTDRKGGGTRHR
jgi:hypothetical protein